MQAILVLNCGSSSVKFAIITPENGNTILSGVAERLSSEAANITIKYKKDLNCNDMTKVSMDTPHADHQQALAKAEALFTQYLDSSIEIIAVGHRVVHGGELFSQSCIVDDAVISGIEKCASLAPLHNPANLIGIKAAQAAYPELAQITVFDTAFHQSIESYAYLYALPYHYYQEYGIRRYGFHGTSYRYIVSKLQSDYSDLSQGKVIVAHLGNGGSVAAIHKGKVVDTSMGMTPLEGLVHGTRSGDIDPAIVEHICHRTGKGIEDVNQILWKESGLLGLSETTNDCRELEQGQAEGDEKSQRALDVYCHRLVKYIGSYAAVLNGVDAIVFTGGIGENSDYIRSQVCQKLTYLGFDCNQQLNADTIRGKSGDIGDSESKPILVIPTNEELMIAQDAFALLSA